jgi:hypothetical protein
MLGSMTYGSKEMTYGAPGVTTTASSASRANPLSQMPPLSGRASAPGTGGSALETRLEQLQREVAESTARVQALKNRNTTIASNSTARAGAAPPAAAAAQARSEVGAKGSGCICPCACGWALCGGCAVALASWLCLVGSLGWWLCSWLSWLVAVPRCFALVLACMHN